MYCTAVYRGQLGERIPVRISQDRALEETCEEKMVRARGRWGGASEDMGRGGEESVRTWRGKEPVEDIGGRASEDKVRS